MQAPAVTGGFSGRSRPLLRGGSSGPATIVMSILMTLM